MQRSGDQWAGIALSVVLHLALLAALVYGWMLFRRAPRPTPSVAIQATAVDARSLRALSNPAPAARPPPAAPSEPQGPPQPTADELARREAQRQAAQQAQEQQREAQQRAREAQQRAEQQAAQEQRHQQELQAQRAAEEKKREAEQAAAQQRAAAEKAARAAAQQKQAEAQEAREREADLKRSLAAEESAAPRDAAALASWVSQITARIQRAWLRPPTARAGIQCVLNVTQTRTGEVTQVSFGACNADAAVRDSIEAAVYRASPLPPPPDPSLFDRDLKINFKPDAD